MISSRIKEYIKQFGIFYLAGFAVILEMKLFYSNAGSDELQWILAPTAWWVRALSGIAFEYQPQIGYVSHACRFVIASSCSGVQFMMVTTAALIFSYIHRMKTVKKRLCWLMLCLTASYLFTVFVNGIRIVISIYLPMAAAFHRQTAGLGSKRLHTVIGIAVYFTSLFIIYHLAGYVSRKITAIEVKDLKRASSSKHSLKTRLYQCAPPVFWYFFIVLGIPFLNRAYKNNQRDFGEYALLMTAVCFVIVLVYCLSSFLTGRHGRKQNSCYGQKSSR